MKELRDTTLLCGSNYFAAEYSVNININSWELFSGVHAIDFTVDENFKQSVFDPQCPNVSFPVALNASRATPSSAKRKQQSLAINSMMDKLLGDMFVALPVSVDLSRPSQIDQSSAQTCDIGMNWLGMEEFLSDSVGHDNLLQSPIKNRVQLLKIDRSEYHLYVKDDNGGNFDDMNADIDMGEKGMTCLHLAMQDSELNNICSFIKPANSISALRLVR